MRAITEIEFQQNIKNIYEDIFANEDPYRDPFQPGMSSRLLLYWFSYGLRADEPWLTPIVAAMKLLGEGGFYLTLLGRPGPQPWHWYIPVEEAGSFIQTTYPRECAIYSINGKWGIIESDEEHAIAGGTEVFIQTIRNSIPDWDTRLNMFLDRWKNQHSQNQKIKIDWLPILLAHVYGTSEAQKILLDAKLK